MNRTIVTLIIIICLFSLSVQALEPGKTYFTGEENIFKYIIKPGDTLYNIAIKYQINLKRLMRLNPNLNPNDLQIGEQVIITINQNLDYYIIQLGDNIWEISQTTDLSVNDILAYNKIENPKYLLPGQVIFLPGIIVKNNNIKVLQFENKYGLIYVSGVARVFEATVNYVIETETGEVLKKGFTTATMGAPGWGKYQIKVADIPKRAHFIAIFNISAKDGSRQNEIKLKL